MDPLRTSEFLDQLVSFAYAKATSTGPHITRYAMYRALNGKLADRDGQGKRVLSVSGSGYLARNAGLHVAEVFDARFPSFSVENLPFNDEEFDFVISDQVLEHVRGPLGDAVAEMMRVLRPGGAFIHTTCFMNLVHGAPSDYWRFTTDGLRELFRSHGREIETGAWGNRTAMLLLEGGNRFLPVPNDPDNPIHQIATRLEPHWPITVWVSGLRSDSPAPVAARKYRKPPHATADYHQHPGERRRLAVVASVRNEASYLLEWIAYHRVVGVDHFFIYDNESNDSTAEILCRLSQAGIVSACFWESKPDINKQVSAYSDAILRFTSDCEWVAFIDADEFIVPTAGASVLDALSDYEQAAAVGVHWRVFGSAGQQVRSPGLVMDRFTRATESDARPNRHIKTISRGTGLTFANVHMTKNSGGPVVAMDKTPIDYETRGLLEAVVPGPLVINHYFCKSFEEFCWKRDRGRGAVAPGQQDEYRPDLAFRQMDHNDVEDTTILRFRHDVGVELQRLEKMVTG